MENPPDSTKTTPKPVRQTPAWLTAFLRWGLVILLAFALGAVLVTLVFYLPLQQTHKQVSNDLASADAENIDLTGQVELLTTDNETCQQNLADASLKHAITAALSEVRAARLAIAVEDTAGARLAVTRVMQSLDILAGLVNSDNRDIVSDLQEKAAQVNTDLPDGLKATLPALEQLDANLVSFLNTLFPSP